MLAYGSDIWSRLLAAVIALVVIIGDWLDGHLARRLNQSTTLGSLLDVAADRIVECVLWIVLADLRLIPVWIPVVIISRGILTDTLRGYALKFGHSGFGNKTMMQSKVGRWLTGSPFMRTSYAVLKAFSFSLLLLLAWVDIGLEIGYWSAVLAAVVCLLRGVPVMIEGYNLVRQQGDDA
jgi:CDP-diacylglycerol--glycerol-3-phosphate 3-phosphatidyltransferase